MSVTIGGVDPVSGIVNLELRVGVLEKLLQIVSDRGITFTKDEIEKAQAESLVAVKARYPQLGLELKK